MKEIIIGTAGHIDHGKTTLVKALTGVDTDTLKEEKKRGITIETGVAHWDNFIPDVKITFMDVPGHEKFIRNMVAGVQSVHLFLLVVAADDGIMPQTREHLDILNILDIRHGVVVITKAEGMDSEWLDLIREEITTLLSQNRFQNIPVCVTDSLSGLGLDELKNTLRKSISSVRSAGNWRKHFYMPVDKVFQVPGFGTVFRGTIEGGTVHVKDTVQLYPGNQTGRVRALHSHNAAVQEARSGMRSGINVADVSIQDVPENVLLAAPGSLENSRYWLVRLQVLSGAPRPVKHMDQLHVLHTTRHLVAHVRLLEGKEIPAGTAQMAILDFKTPVPFNVLDRPVLRQFSPLITLGGAVVILPFSTVPPKKIIRSHMEHYQKIIDSSGLKKQVMAFIQSASPHPVPIPLLERLFNRELKNEIEELMQESQIDVKNQVAISQEIIQQVSRQLETLTRNYFNRYRDVVQVSVHQLDPWGFSETEWDVMLTFLNGRFPFPLQNRVIFREGLSEELHQLQDQILSWIRQQGHVVIEWKQIQNKFREYANSLPVLFRHLEQDGRVVKAGSSLWISVEFAGKIRAALIEHFSKNEELSVGDVKEMLQITRKNAIPVLEFTDAAGWTERHNNNRRVGEKLHHE